MEQIRQKAKLFLNGVIRAKVKEYEALCHKYPEFCKERELPEGGITKGGFLQDLEVWRYALQPDPNDPKKRTLIDELIPDLELVDASTWPQTGTSSNLVITEVQWSRPENEAESAGPNHAG